MHRIFPRWFYTAPVGTVIWIATMWCTFHNFDLLGKNGGPWWFWAFAIAMACASVFLTYVLVRDADPPRQSEGTSGPRVIPYRAYLVIHLDIRQSPPVATFADVYSASASDLTSVGGEAHADLYSLTGESYHQAHEELMQIIPLYFPWVMPLLTRQR